MVLWTCPRCQKEYPKAFKDCLRTTYCKPCNNIVRPKSDQNGENNPFFGRKHTEETLAKQRGPLNPMWKGLENNKCLECGKGLCGRNVFYCTKHWQLGSRNPSWNETYDRTKREQLRLMPEYAVWQSETKKRDNFECQKCCKRGKLHSHHIQPYSKFPELRYELSNGITLCKECHREFHSIYGQTAGLEFFKLFMNWE